MKFIIIILVLAIILGNFAMAAPNPSKCTVKAPPKSATPEPTCEYDTTEPASSKQAKLSRCTDTPLYQQE